ncbi:hypothetical protein [Massilia sp. GCM10023247]|uniref:hypothetical protein n=1 Tax=Massilia sp. GCM10023247 TaxID=3252643 RepID=UPI00362089A7
MSGNMIGLPEGLDSRAHARASRRILAGILVTMLVSGFVSAVAEARQVEEPDWWSLVSALLANFLTFCWFRLDRDARGIRRSVWANLAILLLEPLAILVYVLVSRPRGEKLRGFLRLLGFFLLMMAATILGMIAALGVA